MDSLIITILSGLLLFIWWSFHRKQTRLTELYRQHKALEAKIEEQNKQLHNEIQERRQAEIVLKASELRSRLIIFSAQITVWEWDLKTNEMVWNENLTELFGHPLGHMVNSKRWWLDNVHPDDIAHIKHSIDEYLIIGNEIWREEYRFKRFDGSWSSVVHWGLAIADEAGKPIRMIGALMDITARKQAEERLLQSELNLLEAQRIAHLGSWVWHIESGEMEWSEEQYKIFGFQAGAISPRYQDFINAIHPDDQQDVLTAINNTIDGDQGFALEFRITRPDGTPRWISTQGEITSEEGHSMHKMLGTSMDITGRKHLEEKLKFQAVHDQLTGLFNRRVLEDRLQGEVERAIRYKHSLSIFMLDIDHFKRVNDTYGHSIGDIVIKTIASILDKTIRKTDYLARFGGEEFVVILPETTLNTALVLAERLRTEIATQPISIEDHTPLKVTASIGISSFPEHTQSPQELLGLADIAMYSAKREGRNRVHSADSLQFSKTIRQTPAKSSPAPSHSG